MREYGSVTYTFMREYSSHQHTFMRESYMSNIGSKSLTTPMKSPLAGGIRHIDAFRINIPC